MIMHGIVDNRLPADIFACQDKEEILDSLLDLLSLMQKIESDRLSVSYDDGENGLYTQTVGEISFADWLYDPTAHNDISNDIVKELRIKLEKCRSLDHAEYSALMDTVEKNSCGQEGELIVSIHTDTTNVLYVSTISRYWLAKQWYLSRFVKKAEFAREASECFPHLFFHNNISSSINTLNVSFTQERALIVQHLQALDGFFSRFKELRTGGMGNRDLCTAFQEYAGIECSPQGGRGTVQNLFWEFTNAKKASIRVCCECHTKLKYKDMAAEKQDRIYFDPGSPDIEGGKILIAHIGKHL